MKIFYSACLFCFFYGYTFAQIKVSTITNQFPGSGGVKLDQEGNIYIGNFGDDLSESTGSQIWRIDKSGNRSLFASGFIGASGNAFDSQGNFYQANISGSSISKITPGGETSTFVTNGISCPVGIVFDQDDNMYVCNCCGNLGNTIRKVTPSGVSTRFASGSIFRCPNGITIDPSGNLYVSNFGNGSVIKITPQGTPSFFANIPGNNNGHIAYSAAHNALFVNSHGSSNVYKLTLDGDRTLVAGTGVRGNKDGMVNEATFSRPNGVALTPSGDTLYLNSSIPTVDNLAANIRPLNPSVVRMITGLGGGIVSDTKEEWQYKGVELRHFPNPVKEKLTITYDLPVSMPISVQLFDLLGRKIATLDEGQKVAGSQTISYDVSQLEEGIYHYSLIHKDFVMTRRVMVGR